MEYKYGNSDAVAFDSSASQPVWQSLLDVHHPSVNFQDIADDRIFEQEIMPYILSDENPGKSVSPCVLPWRSARTWMPGPFRSLFSM